MITFNCFKMCFYECFGAVQSTLAFFWMFLISLLYSVVCCVGDLISQCNFSNCVVQLFSVALYMFEPPFKSLLVKTIQLNIHSASVISLSHSPIACFFFFWPNHQGMIIVRPGGETGGEDEVVDGHEGVYPRGQLTATAKMGGSSKVRLLLSLLLKEWIHSSGLLFKLDSSICHVKVH